MSYIAGKLRKRREKVSLEPVSGIEVKKSYRPWNRARYSTNDVGLTDVSQYDPTRKETDFSPTMHHHIKLFQLKLATSFQSALCSPAFYRLFHPTPLSRPP